MRGNKHVRRRQGGATVVEFGLIVVAFLLVVFGIVECARLMFAFNAIHDVTRRAATAAAGTGFADTDKLNTLRRNAIYRTAAGSLPLVPQVTDATIRIDYLWLSRSDAGALKLEDATGGTPSNLTQNQANCINAPYDAGCIRFVRVRLCDAASPQSCQPVNFKSMTGLVQLTVPLYFATTITPIQVSAL